MCGPREQVIGCADDAVAEAVVAEVVAVASVPSTPEAEVEEAPRLCVTAGGISEKT